MSGRDIGVPGAVAEALRRLAERVPPERLDRVWIFPPLVAGRKESGVVAAGCFGEGDRRVLVTLAYRAEETGKGISFNASFEEQGEAPVHRLGAVIEGAVERSEVGLGSARATKLGGDPKRYAGLVETWSTPDDPARFASQAYRRTEGTGDGNTTASRPVVLASGEEASE